MKSKSKGRKKKVKKQQPQTKRSKSTGEIESQKADIGHVIEATVAIVCVAEQQASNHLDNEQGDGAKIVVPEIKISSSEFVEQTRGKLWLLFVEFVPGGQKYRKRVFFQTFSDCFARWVICLLSTLFTKSN